MYPSVSHLLGSFDGFETRRYCDAILHALRNGLNDSIEQMLPDDAPDFYHVLRFPLCEDDEVFFPKLASFHSVCSFQWFSFRSWNESTSILFVFVSIISLM